MSTAMNTGRFDAVSLGIMWDRLVSLTDEIVSTLVRSSFSTIVYESYDLSCVVLDADTNSIAQGTFGIPAFIGSAPVRSTRPGVGRSPVMPQNEAGMRIDPPVSVPSARGTAPEATATADPDEEPPTMRAGSSGWATGPWHETSPVAPAPSSCWLALATTIAPAARSALTAAASTRATRSRYAPQPPVVGSPHREAGTLEFLHRLEELLGGMCRAGFAIEDVVEPVHADESAEIGSFGHRSRYVAPYVRIKARRLAEPTTVGAKVWLP